MNADADRAPCECDGLRLAQLPAFLTDTAAFCLAFISRNLGYILRRLALPAVAGFLVLYLFLSGYCSKVLVFLSHPSGGIASQILGIAAVGAMVMLLLHAVVVAIIADLGMNGLDAPWCVRRVAAFAWRIYVAMLRLCILTLLMAIVIGVCNAFLDVLPPYVNDTVHVGFLLGIFWLFCRGWFFIAPVCLLSSERSTLRKVWQQSAAHLLPIATIPLLIFAAAATLQLGVEFLLLAVGAITLPGSFSDFAHVMRFYQENLLLLTLLFSLTYLMVTVILTTASIYAYQRLVSGTTSVAA